MNNKKAMIFIICISVLSIFISCVGGSNSTSGGSGSSNDDNNSVTEALEENGDTDEESTDYEYAIDSSTVYIYLSSKTVSGEGASFSESIVTITSAGTYSITGTLSGGQIIVNAGDDDIVKLILNDITISNTSASPIYIANAGKTIVILPAGTSNTVTDTYSHQDDVDPDAALFSKDYLAIYGEVTGLLTVNATSGSYSDGIAGKDGLVIAGGSITVNANDDGIRGKDYLVIRDGTINISGVGGDGLKSTNDDDSTKGYILIENGEIDITSDGDGIAAETDVLITGGTYNIESGGGSSASISEDDSAKGIKGLVSVIIDGGTFGKIDCADDAVHSNDSIVINEGDFNVSSADDGLHADYDIKVTGGTIEINESYEGIESGIIIINGGDLSVAASNDGFNATYGTTEGGTESNDGSCMYINGGTVYVDVSDGDGLDSNGSVVVTGGTTLVHGPESSPEVGMDYNGSCEISGGFIIISGTNSDMTQAPGTGSSQCSLKFMTNSSNTYFHIQDASANDIVTFKPERSYNSIIFSSPDLIKGSYYYIFTSSPASGSDANNDGLYESATYSGSSAYSFKISNIVTTVGSTGGGGGMP